MPPIEIIVQKSLGDCGVAALAMISRIPYQQVYQAASKVEPDVLEKGLHRTELVETARALGFRTKVLRKFDPEEHEGVISLVRAENHRKNGGHYVVLWNGAVVDPSNGLVWPYEEYLKSVSERFHPVALLVVDHTPTR